MSGIVGKNSGRASGIVGAGDIGADAVDSANIADDAIDSEHYADGSIDNAHIADDAIDSEHYADGSIDNAHIADDAIDSEHYADGSIDNAHIADDAIDSEHYTDGSIDEAHIADNAVTLAKMAGGTDGNIISFDASGDPVAIATGSDGEVLTSAGAGAPPAFEAAAGGGITETDWWRLTADITNTDGDITANLERVDTPAASYLGTGMAESSGIFTFPSTGYWIIMVHGVFAGASENDMNCQTLVTLNNSAYAIQAWAVTGQRNAGSTVQTASSQLFLDVTSTTNVKVKFATGSLGSGSVLHGATDATAHYSDFMFIRLGDT